MSVSHYLKDTFKSKHYNILETGDKSEAGKNAFALHAKP